MLRNVSLYGFAKLGPAAINFLAIGWYVRLLGPAEYGRYALVAATVSLASSLAFTWLRVGLIRLLPAFETRRTIFLSTLVQGFVGAMIVSSIVAVVAFALTTDDTVRRLIPLGLLLLWANAAFELNLDLSVSALDPVRYGMITLARSVIGVGSASFLAWKGYGVTGVVAGLILGLLVPLAFTLRQNWTEASIADADPVILREVVSYSFPLVVTMSLEFVVNLSDRYFLGWLRGANALGAYAAGYDLSQQSLTVLLVTVNLAAWPAVLRALETGGEAAARPRVAEQGVLLACVGFPAAAGLALIAPNIVHLFLGAELQVSAGQIVPLIALATLIGGAKSYYFDLAFQLGRATHIQIYIMTSAAITNVVCNLLWIPRYGVFGAAWSTIAAYVVGLGLSAWRGRAVFPIPLPWAAWSRIAVATGAMSAALVPIRDARGASMLVVQMIVAVGVFGIVALLLNVVGSRDRLRRALARDEA